MAEEQATAEVEQSDHPDEGPRIPPERLEARRKALAEVRQFGDPVLKSRASEVTSFGPELELEAERMFGLMREAMGIGLAATQLGAMRRMLVFQAGPDSPPRALINPELEWVSGDLVTAEEGCLSLTNIIVDVERPLHARVSAQDISGEQILIEASGLEARVLQHEMDHLDGVLILDRTTREQRRAALRALRAGAGFDPAMLDPDPDPGEEAPSPGDSVNGSDAER